MAVGYRSCAASGILVASDKLTDEPGRVMRGKNGQVRVTDGPYSETKEVLGGYYTIQAGKLRCRRWIAPAIVRNSNTVAPSRCDRSTR